MPDLEVGLRARERILLRNLLPKEGDLTSIRIIRDLRNSLEFDEADLERLHVGEPCAICGEYPPPYHGQNERWYAVSNRTIERAKLALKK